MPHSKLGMKTHASLLRCLAYSKLMSVYSLLGLGWMRQSVIDIWLQSMFEGSGVVPFSV